jgi:hypothetical protein
VHAAIDSGELVISWLNRGTLHLVCREDYPWLHALTAPMLTTMNKRRVAQEGVSDPERALGLIVKALDSGPLLRKEIGAQVGAGGQALTHLLLAGSLRGLVVRGPIRGREQTFALTRDHIGELPDIDRESALRELAQRYVAGHAQASEADLAYWSGLPLRDARAGMAAVAARNKRGQSTFVTPRLLPAFDPYIMGWKERSFAIPDGLMKRVMPGGGMFRAVVLVDGRVTGTWSRAGGRVQIDAPDADGFDAEIADVERFLA